MMKASVRIPCQTKNLKEVREATRRFMQDLPISAYEANLILVAIDEICANAIIHANHSDPDRWLVVRLAYKNPFFQVEVEYQGAGFDYKNHQSRPVDEIKDSGRKGGLGLQLVENIMDKVEFKFTRGKNVCLMNKNLLKPINNNA
ncbi:serine/threonine-protein kinase RsbW [Catalinimonas alkaloidigena]|uniref:Serine/threonine-protein kinase RsbW n=1 Tax=Catalinimonas alkaloidigena TaxID=1075417 RepID=A0A1G9RII8_9BACT|nr:ATP-binding protein [Catalinimonas alkaloidigena]SDM23013.1 serine/threonine-protein kinase RsbW [Catalinimonas alkaloidigena]